MATALLSSVVYVIYKQLYLDPYSKSYKHIYTINTNNNRLSIKNISITKLSPYKERGGCVYAICNPSTKSLFDNELELYNHLLTTGFNVQKGINIADSALDAHADKKLFCYIS